MTASMLRNQGNSSIRYLALLGAGALLAPAAVYVFNSCTKDSDAVRSCFSTFDKQLPNGSETTGAIKACGRMGRAYENLSYERAPNIEEQLKEICIAALKETYRLDLSKALSKEADKLCDDASRAMIAPPPTKSADKR